jgi:hypothetical protein
MSVETDSTYRLRLPSEQPPPHGKTLLLLTWAGTICKGQWDGSDCAWAPLPKETAAIKEARAEYWRTKANAGVYGGRGLL